MQTQQLNWPSFWIEVIRTLGPAVITLIGTLIVLRHQKQVKTIEIDNGTKLKARELLFNSYEKSLEQLTEQLDNIGKVSGELMATFGLAKTDIERERILTTYAATAISLATQIPENDELIDDLKQAGLLAKYSKHIEAAGKLLHSDIENPTLEAISKHFENVSKGIVHLLVIKRALVQQKREELFQEFL